MPSASLLQWRNDWMPRLQQVDLQCAASLAAVPPNHQLIEENLRGGAIPAGTPPLSLPLLQAWRNSCDGLAASLDTILYNVMRAILHRAPW